MCFTSPVKRQGHLTAVDNDEKDAKEEEDGKRKARKKELKRGKCRQTGTKDERKKKENEEEVEEEEKEEVASAQFTYLYSA